MRAQLVPAALAALAFATSVHAQQPVVYPPDPLGAAQAVAEPTPDPKAWWSAPEQRNELADPLGARRAPKGSVVIPAPVDASVYRLWGLMPLQTQVLRRDETVYEVWVRPVDASKQAVVRITMRTDGRAFLQARAGRGCCAAGISRLVSFDRELEPAARNQLRSLRSDKVWSQPQHVLVQEEGAVAGVCVEGTAYDLLRVEARRTVHLRRSCDPAEVGSIAAALRTVLSPSQGIDPRFDAAFKNGVSFEKDAAEFAGLLARGGKLRPKQGLSASARDVETPEPVDVRTAELDENDPRAEVLAADRAFAARAQVVGAAQAFREFMDEDDGRLMGIGEDPTIGAEAIFSAMGGDGPAGFRLIWEPVEAFVSEAGDMAWTWGRSRWLPTDPEQPERVGRYLTVWRKSDDGKWKAHMDIGNTRTFVGQPLNQASAEAPARQP